MLYALGTITLIVLMQRFLKGFLSTISILLGLVVATFVAWLLGDATFDRVGDADWLGFTPPFAFRYATLGHRRHRVDDRGAARGGRGIDGSIFATGEIVGKRIKKDDVAAAIRADGLATVIGGSFNSFPYTAFSENVGLVRMTGVRAAGWWPPPV